MNLYKITRTDGHDYDEYDALVVRASDPEAALAMLRSECNCYWDSGHASWCDRDVYNGFRADGSNAEVEEIPLDGEPGLIIGSFS